MEITAFRLAQRFIGVKEIVGEMNNPQIMAMLKLETRVREGFINILNLLRHIADDEC
ncbi:MAG: hypothetical protein ACFFG0_06255 [Candidatus Thorarchaeota archaeon]